MGQATISRRTAAPSTPAAGFSALYPIGASDAATVWQFIRADGSTGTLSTTDGTVASVTGTANQIVVTGTTTPVLSISSTFVFPGTATLAGTLTYGGVTLSAAVVGTGAMVLATSPAITTSLTTPSTTFALLNATARTINFGAGADLGINIGHASGPVAVAGALTATGLLTGNYAGRNIFTASNSGEVGVLVRNTSSNGSAYSLIGVGDDITTTGFYMFMGSSNYSGPFGASTPILISDVAAGLTLNATHGSGTVKIKAANTLAATFTGANVVFAGALTVTGHASATGTIRVTGATPGGTGANNILMDFTGGYGRHIVHGADASTNGGYQIYTQRSDDSNTLLVHQIAASGAASYYYGLAVTGSVSATTTLKTGGYTVATLPAGAAGMTAYVTDATVVTAKGVAPTGGGAAIAPVFYAAAWVGT